MQFIDYKGKKVAYYLNGNKKTPIVFIHGFCEDSTLWDDFIEPFEDFQIVRIDLPGFGNSEVVDNISIEGMAETAMAVLDHLKIKNFFLIGHSMGGYASLEIAKRRGDQILGLSMFHSHPYADTDEKKQARLRDLEFIETNGHELYVKQLIPNLFAPGFAVSHTYLVDMMILRASKFPREGVTNALRAMIRRADNSDVLKKATYPVNFIIGELDSTIPLEVSLAQTHLPAVADIQLMPKVGHMGMIKARRETQVILRKFLEFCMEK